MGQCCHETCGTRFSQDYEYVVYLAVLRQKRHDKCLEFLCLTGEVYAIC